MIDDLDETDREIVRLLLDDARRPYSEIAERVDLSGPAVSDRVDRLRERGVLRRFTVELDRATLREGPSVLATLSVRPDDAAEVQSSLADHGAVEHVFRTVDGTLLVAGTVPGGDVPAVLSDVGVVDDVTDLSVDVLAETTWSPGLGTAEFAPDCAECGNTVDAEGVARDLDGDRHHFCCESCESAFVERYEELSGAAGD